MEQLLVYNHFHNILRLFDILTNFSYKTRETKGAITSNKHGICKLPNDVKLRTLGN